MFVWHVCVFVWHPDIMCVLLHCLRNRVRYPFYFQLLSTAEMQAFAYYGVITEYGWRRLALIVQNENLFTVVSGWGNGVMGNGQVVYMGIHF